MRFNLANGMSRELGPVDWIAPDNLPDGSIKLRVLLANEGFQKDQVWDSHDVIVSVDEYQRCIRVARHVFDDRGSLGTVTREARRLRREWEAKQRAKKREAEREAEQAALASA